MCNNVWESVQQDQQDSWHRRRGVFPGICHLRGHLQRYAVGATVTFVFLLRNMAGIVTEHQ
jgi:hypothetical protein